MQNPGTVVDIKVLKVYEVAMAKATKGDIVKFSWPGVPVAPPRSLKDTDELKQYFKV